MCRDHILVMRFLYGPHIWVFIYEHPYDCSCMDVNICTHLCVHVSCCWVLYPLWWCCKHGVTVFRTCIEKLILTPLCQQHMLSKSGICTQKFPSYMFIYVYPYMCIHICVFLRSYRRIHIWLFICMVIYVYPYMCVHMCVCESLLTYVPTLVGLQERCVTMWICWL